MLSSTTNVIPCTRFATTVYMESAKSIYVLLYHGSLYIIERITRKRFEASVQETYWKERTECYLRRIIVYQGWYLSLKTIYACTVPRTILVFISISKGYFQILDLRKIGDIFCYISIESSLPKICKL